MSAAGSGILARKLTRPAPAESAGAPPPMRALRMAVARASREVFGTEIGVSGVELGQSGLDDLVAGLGPAHCLIGLEGQEGLIGLAIADAEATAATGELLTTGRIKPASPEGRSPTEVDAALLAPFLSGLIAAILRDCGDAPPGDWFAGIGPGKRFAGTLALCLALPERPYRLLRMTLDLGAGGRQGEIAFALPAPVPQGESRPARRGTPDWSALMSEVVMQTPTEVEAILGRILLPLSMAEALKAGQVLPLLELDIAAVSLEASDGSRIANGRLGQSGGMRAVRVEPRPEAALEEGGHFRPPPRQLPQSAGEGAAEAAGDLRAD